MNQRKSYSQLLLLSSFTERVEYLKIQQPMCEETFGWDRYLNQNFYRSADWKRIRDTVIIRDNGCDLGLINYPITGRILIHHINPVTVEDFINFNPEIVNLDNLICVSHETHNMIHYGSEVRDYGIPLERTPNDQCPWKK